MKSKFLPFPNFRAEEFQSPDEKGSGEQMQVDFLRQLQAARYLCVTPFRISSGYRSINHNRKVGGVRDSSHLYGWAADLQVRNNFERQEILTALIEVGFNRIGIGTNYIHVDNDPNKPINRIWLY